MLAAIGTPVNRRWVGHHPRDSHCDTTMASATSTIFLSYLQIDLVQLLSALNCPKTTPGWKDMTFTVCAPSVPEKWSPGTKNEE